MGTPHVISALTSKRTELVARVDALQAELRQAMIDLDHLDSTLRLFDPDSAPDPVKLRLPPATKRAGAGEITRAVMLERGQNPDDGPLFNKAHARVGTCLRGLRKRETIKSEYGAQGLLVWSVGGAQAPPEII